MFLWNMSKQPGVISSGLKNKLFEKMIKMCLDTIPFFSKNQGCETTMLPEEKLHRFRFLGYLSESIFWKGLFYLPGLVPINVYLFKVNKRNTRTICKISSKWTTKTPELINLKKLYLFYQTSGWWAIELLLKGCNFENNSHPWFSLNWWIRANSEAWSHQESLGFLIIVETSIPVGECC